MSFEAAVEAVLQREGGYVNDPDDPGGETNFGISKRAFPSVDIKGLTREDAIEIYRTAYWERAQCGWLDTRYPPVADFVFDLAVHVGVPAAVRMLQMSLSLSPDGIFGPQTKAAVLALTYYGQMEALLDNMKLQRIEYYLNLVEKNKDLRKYLRGWVRRAIHA